MSEKKGIKESKELIASLVILARTGYGIAKDKKVSIDDLQHIVELAKDLDELIAGFKDLDEVGKEIGDLDEAEAVELIGMLFNGIKEIKEA